MAQILLLTSTSDNSQEVLPAFGLLTHQIRVQPAEASSLLHYEADVVLVDARKDLIGARNLCRVLETLELAAPVIVIFSEGGLAGVSPDWPLTDFLLTDATPAEVEARLRLALKGGPANEPVNASGVEIDENAYSAKLDGRPLSLTYTEFELLKFLAQHPGKVFSREQLLAEVWGYDYYGGTRTVDVHVRRLRAKLGEAEPLIGTVRNVGYRFVPRARADAGPN